MASKSFKTGDLVTVTPKADDVFQNEFTGRISGTHGKYWCVEDGDGDTWDADEDQMKHAGEDWQHEQEAPQQDTGHQPPCYWG